VPDRGVAERFLTAVQAEHARTGAALAEIYGAPVAEARPAVQRRLDRRDTALAPLHARQIALLADWRARRTGGDEAGADALLPELLLSVNAIASGLGATG
jgi:phosphoenolpyruvate carboxylase